MALKTIPKDYEVPESEYDNVEFSDGDYNVKSIRWWEGEKFTNNGKPMLVPQTNGLVGRFNTVLEDEKQGPSMSLELHQMPLLAKAFGAIPVTPPPVNQPEAVSDYMVSLQKAIEESGKVTVARVKDKWIQQIKGMEVPDQYFHFYLSSIWPSEEGSRPRQSNPDWDPFFTLEFTIHAGENKSDTPYKGCTFTEFVTYAIEVVDGEAKWKTLQDGISPNSAAVRMSRLIDYTCGGLNDFEPEDVNNVLITWAKLALTEKRFVLSGTRVKPEKSKSKHLNKISLALNTVQPAGYSIELENVFHAAPTSTNDNEDEKARETLKEVFLHLNPQAFIEGSTKYDLSEQGILIAKQYITPLKNSGKVRIKQFKEATLDEVVKVLEFMLAETSDSFVLEKKAQLTAFSLGFGAEEENDSPF